MLRSAFFMTERILQGSPPTTRWGKKTAYRSSPSRSPSSTRLTIVTLQFDGVTKLPQTPSSLGLHRGRDHQAKNFLAYPCAPFRDPGVAIVNAAPLEAAASIEQFRQR